MIKLFGMSVVASTMTLISMQEASAWSNLKFGVGLNFQWQSANNAVGKHLWRNGPLPGQMPVAPYYGGGHGHYAPMPAEAPAEAAPMSYNTVAPVYYAPSYTYPTPIYSYGQ